MIVGSNDEKIAMKIALPVKIEKKLPVMPVGAENSGFIKSRMLL